MYIGTTTIERGIEKQIYYGLGEEVAVSRIEKGICISGRANDELTKNIYVELTLEEAAIIAEAYLLLIEADNK
jgi:hypothetical protein